ncbi:hypothetical protein BLOT_012423 [Blomia tropicalis]|nr:hypothetical protein BLOT_012423 [Blomia tropicalis]
MTTDPPHANPSLIKSATISKWVEICSIAESRIYYIIVIMENRHTLTRRHLNFRRSGTVRVALMI